MTATPPSPPSSPAGSTTTSSTSSPDGSRGPGPAMTRHGHRARAAACRAAAGRTATATPPTTPTPAKTTTARTRGQDDAARRAGYRGPEDGSPAPRRHRRRQQERLERSKAAAREVILRQAVALLSGPGGLASWLRTGQLPAPAGSVSLPLDVGTVTELVPPHLRRAITARDQHCAAPGCDTPPPPATSTTSSPEARAAPPASSNCVLLCSFHHLILIHRWGWTITLNADGTTTARSPAGRILHSHGPPLAA